MSLVSENRIKLMKSDIVEKILKKNKLTDNRSTGARSPKRSLRLPKLSNLKSKNQNKLIGTNSTKHRNSRLRSHSPNNFTKHNKYISLNDNGENLRSSFSPKRIEKMTFEMMKKATEGNQTHNNSKDESYYFLDLTRQKKGKEEFLKKIKKQNKFLFSKKKISNRYNVENSKRSRNDDRKILDFYKEEFENSKKVEGSLSKTKIPSNIPYHVREEKRMPETQKQLVLFKSKKVKNIQKKSPKKKKELELESASKKSTSPRKNEKKQVETQEEILHDDDIFNIEIVKNRFEKYSNIFINKRESENYGKVIKNSDRAEMYYKFFSQTFLKLQTHFKKILDSKTVSTQKIKEKVDKFYKKYEEILNFFSEICGNLFIQIHNNYQNLLRCLVWNTFEFSKTTRNISYKAIEDIYFSFSGLRSDEFFTDKGLPRIEIWENYTDTLKL